MAIILIIQHRYTQSNSNTVKLILAESGSKARLEIVGTAVRQQYDIVQIYQSWYGSIRCSKK